MSTSQVQYFIIPFLLNPNTAICGEACRMVGEDSGRESGQLAMPGKTFMGLTDDILRWQSERLLSFSNF
jgi:hypothetical protein